MMQRCLRILFVLLIARPIALFIIGINLRHRENLMWGKQSIIVANHNSHLDTLVLLSMVPLNRIHQVHPAAAADYFLRNPLIAWFARNMVGIVAVSRQKGAGHPLAECLQVLAQGHSLIIFPEGTRGEPEQMQKLKAGVAHLVEAHPHIPVTPVFMYGLGRALPKGEWLLVPFFCDLFVGDAIFWANDRKQFLAALEAAFEKLRGELPATWMKEH